MNRRDVLIYVLLGGLLTFATQELFRMFADARTPKPSAPQTQKFRFGEQCPDGLRVEYISTIRLPKAVVCQKAVGE